jgi:hypothetical protein
LEPGHEDGDRLPERSSSRGVENGKKGRLTER